MRFFDASALVKRYALEEGSTLAGQYLREGPAAESRLSEAEVSSALARRKRAGEISPPDYERALGALLADLTRLTVVELTAMVFARVH
jgi:predicted nucleic acid-binding protein